jgi:hypothetical protein
LEKMRFFLMYVEGSPGQFWSNGRSFFNTALVQSQSWRGERFKWPTSLIHKITDDVCFAKPIKRPHYPTKWLLTSSSG